MNRRDFLRSVLAAGAALPALPVGDRWVSKPEPMPATLRLPLARWDVLKILRWSGSVNARQWRGHAPGTILLTDATGHRLANGQWDVEITISKTPGPFCVVYPTYQEVKTLELCNRLDFALIPFADR